MQRFIEQRHHYNIINSMNTIIIIKNQENNTKQIKITNKIKNNVNTLQSHKKDRNNSCKKKKEEKNERKRKVTKINFEKEWENII